MRTMVIKEQNISVGEFKEHCLRLMNEVSSHKISITITKRGKPIARLVPIDTESSTSLYGRMKGSMIIHGDIIEPLDTSGNQCK